jgi:hypothetical protein
MLIRLVLTNDPKVQKMLQERANQMLIVLLKQQQQQQKQQQQVVQPGYIFEVEIQIRHSWQSILELRRRHRRLQRAAENADAIAAAAENADAIAAAADNADAIAAAANNSGGSNAAADLNADDNKFKAEDDADAENIGRMSRQNLMPRPLLVTAKCVCVPLDSGSTGSSSSSSSSVHLKADVVSITSRFATDAEMARAGEDGQVLSCCCCRRCCCLGCHYCCLNLR